MKTSDAAEWRNVEVPDGCTLRHKQLFEYTTQANVYDLELYENQGGTWYAIAIPREGERLIIYGSNEVPTAQMAIQIVVDKIKREGLEETLPPLSEHHADYDA